LHGRPLSLGYFRNPELHAAIRDEHAKKNFDAVIVFSSSMAQYVEHFYHIPRIMNFCDVDSRKWESLARKAHGPKRWIYTYESRTLLKYEQKIAATFDTSCVVSANEADLFRKHIPGVPVYVLENGVDVDYFSAVPRKCADVHVVFVGVMDYPPNVEAVSFFVHDVWDKVLKVFPAARFTIVGAKPVKCVRDLGGAPGVEVTGYVPDVRPYLAAATISIAPLAVARGVQNKILEAMAAGVPVLTTPNVAKGLPVGAQALVSTASWEAEAFAITLLDLIKNETSREDLAKKAREFIRKSCTWEVKLQTMDALLAQVLRGTSKKPADKARRSEKSGVYTW
jgi:sugar transferase (PEP-CTERM/EpsH1 system associated)